MRELIGLLLPEMVGLAVTPAAVVACLLLLSSSHPWRNVAVFAGVFACVYAAVAALIWGVGDAAGASDDHQDTVRGWVSLALGLLFLLGAAASGLRRSGGSLPSRGAAPRIRAVDDVSGGTDALPRPAADLATAAAPGADEQVPGWVRQLRDPAPRLVVTSALVLSVVNPNVAILASGIGVVMTAEVSGSTQLVGVILLLSSSMADFVVPALIFAFAGARGRQGLVAATSWLVRHNRAIGVGVLIFFGLLFSSRGFSVLG